MICFRAVIRFLNTRYGKIIQDNNVIAISILSTIKYYQYHYNFTLFIVCFTGGFLKSITLKIRVSAAVSFIFCVSIFRSCMSAAAVELPLITWKHLGPALLLFPSHCTCFVL